MERADDQPLDVFIGDLTRLAGPRLIMEAVEPHGDAG